MDKICYYCEQGFQTQEKLTEHLEVHANTIDQQKKKRKKKR